MLENYKRQREIQKAHKIFDSKNLTGSQRVKNEFLIGEAHENGKKRTD
jgi:hypothetical protein